MNPQSKPLVHEWIEKAEGDFEAALHLNKSRKVKRIYFIIAFHCQQAIEKYLKALLICHKIDFPKTHDLLELLDLIKSKDRFLFSIAKEFKVLNPFAIGFRYPGDSIELAELKQVVAATKKLRLLLLQRLKEFVRINP
jgi:HEPN domain-containing protein